MKPKQIPTPKPTPKPTSKQTKLVESSSPPAPTPRTVLRANALFVAPGVAVSPRLEAYLALELVMRALDDSGDAVGDALRDDLDPLWYALTDDERAYLNARSIAVGPVCAVRLADRALESIPQPHRSVEPRRRERRAEGHPRNRLP